MKNLNLGKLNDKIVLWRKITRALKDLYTPKIKVNNADENKSNSKQNEYNMKIGESVTQIILKTDIHSFVLDTEIFQEFEIFISELITKIANKLGLSWAKLSTNLAN